MIDTWTLPNGEVIDYWPPSEPGVLDDAAAQLTEVLDRIADLREEPAVAQDKDPFLDALEAAVAKGEAERKEREAAEARAKLAEQALREKEAAEKGKGK